MTIKRFSSPSFDNRKLNNMNFKKYAVIMLVATVVLWGLWGVVLVSMNPFEDGKKALFLFYGALFCALTGTFACISGLYRHIRFKRESEDEHAIISFRHAFWFAFVACFALFLQANRLMTWLNLLLFIALVAIIEFLILSYTNGSRIHNE